MWTGTDYFVTDGNCPVTLKDGRKAEIFFSGRMSVEHYSDRADIIAYEQFRTDDAVLLDDNGDATEITVRVDAGDYEKELDEAVWKNARHTDYVAA